MFGFLRKPVTAAAGWFARRWEAAQTDRLNSAHWAGAEGHHSIDEDLALDWETIRVRTMHEVQNNGFVEGMIHTHQVDVVGPHGPSLQVQMPEAAGFDAEAYGTELEQAFHDWSDAPELTGQHSLADLLQLDVRNLWATGDFFDQLVHLPDVDDPISLRLNPIHPRRVRDPLRGAPNDTLLGITRDKFGRPIEYNVIDFDSDARISLRAFDESRIPAARMIHGFRPLESGQIRGCPWLAPVLGEVADLRDFDAQVMDAARAAADSCVILATDHPDSNYLEVNESTEFQRRTIRTAPPGWKPHQMKAEQPTATYKEFRAERLRVVGRPVSMPLMIVTLDSSNHNFSSARFDGQRYKRGIEVLQAWLTRVKLRRLLRLVADELEAHGEIPPRPRDFRGRPVAVRATWTWPIVPHVDPQKEAQAWNVLVHELGIASEFDAAAAMGFDYETVCALRERARLLREAHSIPDSDTTSAAARSLLADAVRDVLGEMPERSAVGFQVGAAA